MEYDFFEHLVIKEQQTLDLETKTQSISALTYAACLAFYSKETGLSFIDNNDSIHLNEFNKLMQDVNFYTCIAYDLKNKYALIPSVLTEKETIPQFLVRNIKAKQQSLSEHGLYNHLELNINRIFSGIIEEIIKNGNFYYPNPDCDATGYAGFFNSQEVSSFIKDNIQFALPNESVIIFRDNYHKKLRQLIKTTSIHRDNNKNYNFNIDIAMAKITPEIDSILDKMINLKQHIKYYEYPQDLLEIKKSQLTSSVNEIMMANKES